MDILFITRRFLPNGDATGTVVYNFCRELVRRGHQIKVLSITDCEEDQKISNYDGIETIHFYVPETKSRSRIKAEAKTDIIRTSFTIARLAVDKIVAKIRPIYKKLSLNPTLVRAYKKAYRLYKNSIQFDECIITLMPHEAIFANEKVCIAKKYVMLQLDTCWNNDLLPSKYKNDRMIFEFNAIENSLFTMALPNIYRENIIKEKKLGKRMILTELPMIIEPEKQTRQTVFEDNKIHIVFLGTLYHKIRPPYNVVHLISMMKSKMIVFDFYGVGQELIRDMSEYEEVEQYIELHGPVSSKEAIIIRDQADILVNIDNTTILQVPSKIFEYICTGKPIINFYFSEASSVLEYLSKYPNCLNVHITDNIDPQYSDMVKNFIYSNKGTTITFDEIQKNYIASTPSFVADQFENRLREIYGHTQ